MNVQSETGIEKLKSISSPEASSGESGNGGYTIADIARELGVSKTTVSRAISGKGRIGSGTRDRVLSFIEKNNYRPNPLAKGLANSRTYNICWAMPGDSTMQGRGTGGRYRSDCRDTCDRDGGKPRNL